MSCSISHCFGKSRQSIDSFKKSTRSILSSKKKQKRKRYSNYRKKHRKTNKKNRYSKRKFGYKVLRNDQIIELVNSNKVYNNKICN